MGSLQDRRALVTGGTTGLGFAIAERFLAEGAQVVITGPDAVAASVAAAADRLGGLDVLVNNAGIGVTARLIDTPLADYDRVMNVNVRGYLLYAQHSYVHLARSRGC